MKYNGYVSFPKHHGNTCSIFVTGGKAPLIVSALDEGELFTFYIINTSRPYLRV
jgi:hypothetical protein